MQNNQAIKSCSFCESEAKDTSHSSCDCCGKHYNGQVTCQQCGAQLTHFDTNLEAIAAWNKRPSNSAPMVPLDELLELLKRLESKDISLQFAIHKLQYVYGQKHPNAYKFIGVK
jgi:predicted amidophosphoribosyltransferase